jgi:hypothetical protein
MHDQIREELVKKTAECESEKADAAKVSLHEPTQSDLLTVHVDVICLL